MKTKKQYTYQEPCIKFQAFWSTNKTLSIFIEKIEI